MAKRNLIGNVVAALQKIGEAYAVKSKYRTVEQSELTTRGLCHAACVLRDTSAQEELDFTECGTIMKAATSLVEEKGGVKIGESEYLAPFETLGGDSLRVDACIKIIRNLATHNQETGI